MKIRFKNLKMMSPLLLLTTPTQSYVIVRCVCVYVLLSFSIKERVCAVHPTMQRMKQLGVRDQRAAKRLVGERRVEGGREFVAGLAVLAVLLSADSQNSPFSTPSFQHFEIPEENTYGKQTHRQNLVHFKVKHFCLLIQNETFFCS